MNRPIVWTIAGSDSGGGAGIQADLKTMNAFGVHGCSVITALTAQNTGAVTRVDFVGCDMLGAQMDALADDLPPAAVKIGMVGGAANISSLAARLKALGAYVVCDPVMVSGSGTELMPPDTRQAVVGELLPVVNLLTPNLPEAEVLLGRRIEDHEQMERAAADILRLGPKSVLLKGGHGSGRFSQDVWTDGTQRWWFTSPRQDVTETHGTGCTLSAATAACRARGYTELDSLVLAKAYVNQGLREGEGIGKGRIPLAHGPWPSHAQDMPWMTRTAPEGRRLLTFPDCGSVSCGFYPIVDRASWVERLAPLGVPTIQLRAKDLAGEDLEREAAAAVEAAKRHGARLFINDNWQLAIRCGAYGVHLGPGDLSGVDLGAIMKAGLRLGVSAYSYADSAVACSIRPSYTALGAVFATASKDVTTRPLGLEELARMRRLLAGPVVAIGGITLERAADVLAAGADGIAVISDVMDAPDPEARVRAWMELTRSPTSKVQSPKSS